MFFGGSAELSASLCAILQIKTESESHDPVPGLQCGRLAWLFFLSGKYYQLIYRTQRFRYLSRGIIVSAY